MSKTIENENLNLIVKFFLEAQATLQLYHWNTRSHPRHLATDELLAQFRELGDTIIETAIGALTIANMSVTTTGNSSSKAALLGQTQAQRNASGRGGSVSDIKARIPSLEVKSHDDAGIVAYLETLVGVLNKDLKIWMGQSWDQSGIASPRDDLLTAIYKTQYLYRFN